jgi:hypothetical protein
VKSLPAAAAAEETVTETVCGGLRVDCLAEGGHGEDDAAGQGSEAAAGWEIAELHGLMVGFGVFGFGRLDASLNRYRNTAQQDKRGEIVSTENHQNVFALLRDYGIGA